MEQRRRVWQEERAIKARAQADAAECEASAEAELAAAMAPPPEPKIWVPTAAPAANVWAFSSRVLVASSASSNPRAPQEQLLPAFSDAAVAAMRRWVLTERYWLRVMHDLAGV